MAKFRPKGNPEIEAEHFVAPERSEEKQMFHDLDVRYDSVGGYVMVNGQPCRSGDYVLMVAGVPAGVMKAADIEAAYERVEEAAGKPAGEAGTGKPLGEAGTDTQGGVGGDAGAAGTGAAGSQEG